MKSIIEREATFENNSDKEVKVTHTKLSWAFVKETQWSKTCSTFKSTWQAKHRGESPLEIYIFNVNAYTNSENNLKFNIKIFISKFKNLNTYTKLYTI